MSRSAAERIAARDLNNLYLTSCYFADEERYRAFCAQYALMRVVDDRIDAIPSRTALSETQRRRERQVVEAWQTAVEGAYAGRPAAPAVLAACEHDDAAELIADFAAAIGRFPVPVSLWRNFFAAMARDIERPRFATYAEFLDYAEGATVAPTTIYLYLITARPGDGGAYRPPPGFDLIGCGRCLGNFAYLGHILRDLAKDLATGEEGLLYLAGDDLERFGLTEEELFTDLGRQCSGEPLRRLVEELVGRSRQLLATGRELMEGLEGELTPDCGFVLELIVTFYETLLDRLVAGGFDPLAASPRLRREDKEAIALEVARRRGFDPLPRIVPPAE